MRTRATRKLFLRAAWTFVGWNVIAALVASVAGLPASNGQRGDLHNVGSQALYGDGTALTPPLILVAVVALFVLAATLRRGRFGWVGAAVTIVAAIFYAFPGELGELTTTTSPLTGAKWDLALALGSLGIVIALATSLAGLYWVVASIRERRARQPPPGRVLA